MGHYLSLTDFVDINAASGTSKAAKVRQIASRPPYNPSADFYKRLRDGIVEAHENNLEKKVLDSILIGLSDPKKQTAYPSIVAAYKKWWGKKSLAWFEPPSHQYSQHGVDISVNPELGLEINGVPHLVKLYFKKDNLTKTKIDIITHLMAITLEGTLPPRTIMGLLDVRQSRLFTPTVPVDNLTEMVNAELAYIAALWTAYA